MKRKDFANETQMIKPVKTIYVQLLAVKIFRSIKVLRLARGVFR